MAFGLFKGKKQKSLGIDIGTSSVKVVELAKSGDKIELTNYGEYKGGVDTTIHSSSLKLLSSQAADIIKEILRETGISTREASMSVPIFSGFSTIISLPQMSEAELAQAVEYEAKKYIPLPLSEVQFEWVKIRGTNAEQIRGTDAEDSASVQRSAEGARVQRQFSDSGKARILIVAVTNELINRYHEIAKLGGLTLKYLELETFSLARSLTDYRGTDVEQNAEQTQNSASVQRSAEGAKVPRQFSASLIIDIGSRSTILSVIESGWPVYSRSMNISGRELSKFLATSFGIDFSRAEDLKKNNGIEAGGSVLVPLLDNILQEGRRVIDEYTKKRKRAIGEIIVSGGSAKMPGFLKYIVKSIGRETTIAFPFHDIIYPNELDATLHEIGPSFSVAVGLALREFK